MASAMLVDVSRCMGCRACQIACKEWNLREPEDTRNEGSYENPLDLSAQTWTRIKFIEESKGDVVSWHFRRVLCQHCTNAACEQVCPPKAISHQMTTAVVIDQKKCTGCKYCISACPFDVPRYNPQTNTAEKCTLCIDRISNGLTPACAKVCTTGAVVFGERSKMVSLAGGRLTRLKRQGYQQAGLYGEKDLGGLGVMMLLLEPPAFYGLPEKPEIPISLGIWRDFVKPAIAVAGGGAALAALVSLLGSTGYKASDSSSRPSGRPSKSIKGDKGGK